MELYVMQSEGGQPAKGLLLRSTQTGREVPFLQSLSFTHCSAFLLPKTGLILRQKSNTEMAKRKKLKTIQWPIMLDSPSLGIGAVGLKVNI